MPRWGSVAGRVAVAATLTECRGGLLPLGRASLTAAVLSHRGLLTQKFGSLSDGWTRTRSPRGGSPRPTEGAPLRCLCRVAGGASGGERSRRMKRWGVHIGRRFEHFLQVRAPDSQTFDLRRAWSSSPRVVVVAALPRDQGAAPPLSLASEGVLSCTSSCSPFYCSHPRLGQHQASSRCSARVQLIALCDGRDAHRRLQLQLTRHLCRCVRPQLAQHRPPRAARHARSSSP